MGKRKTILIIILSLALAALLVATAVFGYALARSAYTDTDGMYASEARWKISEMTEETNAGLFVGTEKLKPEYQSYEVHMGEVGEGVWPRSLLPDDDPGVPKMYPAADDDDGSTITSTPRTNEWFGLLAVVENDSEVKADISFTYEGGIVPVTDGCGEDDSRYPDDEIVMHFEAVLYCCLSDGIETSDEAEKSSVTSASLGTDTTDNKAYIYASITWITDLERDINDEVFVYDGSFGDEFDSWAGEHLSGLYLPVTIRAEQAE